MLDREGFRPNVGIILLNQRNQVFWGKRIRSHSWQFPQGGIDRGETPEQAAVRELREETGLTGRINTLIGVTAGPGTLYQSILMLGYLVTRYSGSAMAGDDASDLMFVEKDQLPGIAFESHLSFIRLYYSTLVP